MPPRPGSFAVSAATTKPWSFAEDSERYAALGVGMEVWERKPDPARPDEQFAVLRDLGAAVASVQPRTIALFPSLDAPDPKDPRERAGLYRDSIRRLARHVPGVPFVTNTGALPGGDEAGVWAGCVRHDRELAREAADHGVRIALELLTASLMNRTTVVYRLAEALELAAGYAGPYVLELFSAGVPDSLWDGDLTAVITRSRDHLNGVLAEVRSDHP